MSDQIFYPSAVRMTDGYSCPACSGIYRLGSSSFRQLRSIDPDLPIRLHQAYCLCDSVPVFVMLVAHYAPCDYDVHPQRYLAYQAEFPCPRCGRRADRDSDFDPPERRGPNVWLLGLNCRGVGCPKYSFFVVMIRGASVSRNEVRPPVTTDDVIAWREANIDPQEKPEPSYKEVIRSKLVRLLMKRPDLALNALIDRQDPKDSPP